MKDGYTIKDNSHGEPTQSELELINKYTRRELKASDVYVFSVVLCDNEIDRDNEKFSKESLKKLAQLFVGKTGIYDHNLKSKNQAARIFHCSTEEISDKKNQIDEPYCRLLARAYTTKSPKNAQFILDLDSGIKKEVSIGISVEKIICSICNSDIKSENCHHIRGKKYGQRLCYYSLENPQDAYEWSFVAVPAQKSAGVIKSFTQQSPLSNETTTSNGPPSKPVTTKKMPPHLLTQTEQPHTSSSSLQNIDLENLELKKDNSTSKIQTDKTEKSIAKQMKGDNLNMTSIMKKFETGEEITITKSQSLAICAHIKNLEIQAEDGKEYKNELEKEVLRLCALTQPEIHGSIMKGLTKKMSITELREFKTAFEKKAHESFLPSPQLYRSTDASPLNLNSEFII
jgi:hypothetical protein